MTTITGKVEIGPGRAPSQLTAGKSYVRVRVADMVTTSAGVLMLPIVGDPTPLEDDGSFSVVVDPVPAGFAHVFEFEINNGQWKSIPIVKRVPASGTHDLKDLDDMAPVAGSQFAVPGWYGEVLEARDETLPAAITASAARDQTFAARDQVVAVQATNDGIMASVAANEGSAFRAAMSTTFAKRNPGITLMGLGDSQTANGGHTLPDPANSTRGSYYYGEPAWHLFAQILGGGKFDHIGNAATGGYTIQQIKATHLPAVLRIKPTICVVLAGENNKTNLSAADLADLASIYDQLAAAGIQVVACTIPPTSTIQNVYKLNAWIRRQARLRGIPLADLHSALADKATGGWKAGTNQDGSHPNAAGAMLMGAELARVLEPYVRQGDPDLADDEISTGNLTGKPLFLTNNAGTSADNLPGSAGTPPFPSTGWAASTTFASGSFSFASAETSAEGRYFRGHRVSGVDNWFATSNWTLAAGNVIRIAFGVELTIPAGGKVEMFLLGPSGWSTTPLRAVFTQSIKGVMAFELPIPAGQASYAGFKFQLRLTGADGTVAAIKRWTARDLTALGVA